jgi:hypothetical protein
VDAARTDGHKAERGLQRTRVPHEQERVEPRRHEGEVHDAAGEHERGGDQRDAAAAAQVHHQRNQKQQHPHRTGIEPVHQTQRHRECGKAELREIHAAPAGKFHDDVARRPLPGSCHASLQAQVGDAGAEADPHLAADEERRNPDPLDSALAREPLEPLALLRLSDHVVIADRSV